MNLPCTLLMLFNCIPFPERQDKLFLPKPKASAPASYLLALLGNDDVEEREKKVLDWLDQGQWPEKLRRFKAIQVSEGGHHLVYWVSADYLALGNDADSVLMPLSWLAVKVLAERWQILLPTSKMVDQIYQQATRIQWPHAYPPSDEMRSTAYLVKHNRWIQERTQIDLIDHPLVAGHKKDLVVSPRLLVKTKKLAIYGWHNLGNGTAIQPLSLWHGQFYVDYSHGIRLVAPEAELDGKTISLASILKDPQLATMISFEGAFNICKVLAYPCEKHPRAQPK